VAIFIPLRQQCGEVGKGATGPVSRAVSQKVETERILAELERLAPLPTVVLDIVRAVEDPGSTVADLEAIICRDLTITARVFKLSNSFFYARGAMVRTIGEAVKRLGFRTIKNLVIAAGTGKVLMKPMKHYAYKEFGLWKHSLGLALAVRIVARYLGLPFVIQEELFLAGLMHDIGKLLLDPILHQALPQPSWHTTDSEMAALGLDHAEVGGRMAQKWNLPDYTVAVIQQHHNLDAETDFVRHIAAIHVSDYLINHTKIGIPDEVEVLCQVNPQALAALSIDVQIMAELQKVVSNELPVIIDTCDELIRC
jgi:putative nucleotidyltransferase with HDIG domain